ncbi:MAG TPA: Gfo/Idh/MocA family oxidoreductase [Tepidisphaeraceae bacterium]|nr:Gfo/Idh/MocA family oxidoreductase [Tepidisphaeraceae bacterium]
MSKLRIVGINFDHMHMGDLLRQAMRCPDAQVVGVSDHVPGRAERVLEQIGAPAEWFDSDYRSLLDRTKPDLVLLCPATAEHADWTERVAPFGAHVLVEKPFAASLQDADRMIAALQRTGKQLIINWPLRWYPSHITAKRVIDDRTIGEVIQVHYYDGNRGPLRHVADKVVVPEDVANDQKARSWWYQKRTGGGSLLDYLGYGTTLGTWFMNGRAPVEVMAMTDRPDGLEVDEHSITLARYDIPNSGLSKFETRWGTFTDPWTHQPQPKCGFVIVGRQGTISSYDYEGHIRVQTRDNEPGREVPVDVISPPFDQAINYVAHCLSRGLPVDGPLSPRIARIGQQIVDAAARSASERRLVAIP